MTRNHKLLESFLGIIAGVEILFLILSFVGFDNSTNLEIENAYRICYSFLAAVCLLCQILLEVFYKKKKSFPYFVFVSIFTFSIMMWGAGVSLIASFDSFTFLYYVLVMVAASALICLEPWVETLCVLLTTVCYVIGNYSLDGIQRISDSLFLSGVVMVVLIVLACFNFNFFTRIKAIVLEFEVTKLNDILKDKANTDKLTGVNNRLFLSERLENNVDGDFVNGGMMMIDLDHFKHINDSYGHIAGDKCLSEMGILISNLIEGKDAYCVRYGGEEFLIYFKNINADELSSLAESFRKTVEAHKVEVKKNTLISYTISIGLALGKDCDSYSSLIDISDKALYKAKQNRNTISF